MGHVWRLKSSKVGQDCRMWLGVWGPVPHGHSSEWEIFSMWRWERSWQCPVLSLKIVTWAALSSWWMLSSSVPMSRRRCHSVLKKGDPEFNDKQEAYTLNWSILAILSRFLCSRLPNVVNHRKSVGCFMPPCIRIITQVEAFSKSWELKWRSKWFKVVSNHRDYIRLSSYQVWKIQSIWIRPHASVYKKMGGEGGGGHY